MHSPETHDKRVQSTLTQLREAFNKLVLVRPYEDIKVGDILELAGVGRSTFYQHFKSKDDLFKERLKFPLSQLATLLKPGASLDAATDILLHFHENQSVARIVFSGPARKVVVQAYCELLDDPEYRGIFPRVEIVESLKTQLAEAQFTLVVSWLNGQLRQDAAQVAELIHRTSLGLLSAYKQSL